MRRPLLAAALLALLAGCSNITKPEIIAATPAAITIKSTSLSEPLAMAEAHCRQHGKKAVSRGGIKLGSPGYSVLYGYDCVQP